MKRGTKTILIVIVAIIAIIATYRLVVFIGNKIKPKQVIKEERVIPVKASKAIRMDITKTLNLSGDIVGKEVVNVFSQVPGKVMEILVKEGQFVKKGQVLFRVDRDIVGMEYMPAVVESPLSGYVGTVMVDRGMSISPQTPLAQVVTMNQVEAVAQIIEEQINMVQIGMKAKIRVDAYPNMFFYGTVYRKNAVLDAASRTQEVRILIDNPQLKLRHGMFADIQIQMGSAKNAVVIQVDSILSDSSGNYYVYKVVDNKAFKQSIKPGFSLKNVTEVVSGINEGDAVVTLGKENVGHGDMLMVYMEEIKQ
ncbi:MAG: efflux RND transporter periplasmic adaptor subunit [Spirochaetota bacterium]|nr:efflux RND transporter periplasmic adaptor subunit [Spirochaetota bacterium]